jgi:hypothetical protein
MLENALKEAKAIRLVQSGGLIHKVLSMLKEAVDSATNQDSDCDRPACKLERARKEKQEDPGNPQDN